MAKRRVVTSDIVWQKSFNRLSVEAMALFPKLLSCTDDFGVLPGETEELERLISPPKAIKDFAARIEEYVVLGILHRHNFKGNVFLLFEPDSFDRHQSYFIKKRTKSDYMKLSKAEFQKWASKLFQEIPEGLPKSEIESIESKKQQAESREQEEEGEPEAEIDLNAPPTYDSILKDIQDINENYGGTGNYELRQFRGMMGNHTLAKIKEGVDYWGRKTKKVTPERLEDYLLGKILPDQKYVNAAHIADHNAKPNRATHQVTPERLAEIARHHEERERQRNLRAGFDMQADPETG